MYYNKDEKLDEASLWLVLFTSKSYLEMYNILGKLFDDERREQFIRNVISMNNDKAIFEDWEMEKLNELVKYTCEKNLKEKAMKEGRKEGHKQGFAEGLAEGEEKLQVTIIHHIKNMLKENIDIELISKITNKTKEEILEIKKTL